MPMSQVDSKDDSPSIRRLSILGSTGSIGTQTLDIVRLFPERFRVSALTAGSNVEMLIEQALEFKPTYVSVSDASKLDRLRDGLRHTHTHVLFGREGACEAATLPEVDTVVAAIMGFAGLHSVLAALEAGKKVALANKETLVVGGALVRDLLKRYNATLIPVDSEHSAIFQCLVGEAEDSIEQIILTASGGPFRTRPRGTFDRIRPAEALKHPNWSMGEKITIDSATLMNKGLEVIEAHWIFGLGADQIKVLVHPQSIIHSMVNFVDGSVKAQCGVPDMKVPIQYALSYPDRWQAPHARVDWSQITMLDFELPDTAAFPCLGLAYEALNMGGTAPTILNAVNEEAVSLFLEERIRFTEIPILIESALDRLVHYDAGSLSALEQSDAEARRYIKELKRVPAN